MVIYFAPLESTFITTPLRGTTIGLAIVALWDYLGRMNAAEQYRARAAELRALAANEPSRQSAAEFERMARGYIRLAEQAERNAALDIAVEFGPPVSARGQ